MRPSTATTIAVFISSIAGIHCQTDPSWSKSIVGAGYLASSTRTITARIPWFTRGSIAGECSSGTLCSIATVCKDGKVVHEGGLTRDCTGRDRCFTLTIFERPPNVGPVAYNIGCRDGWPHTAYRQLDALTTDAPPITSTAEIPASPSLSFSTVVSPTSATRAEATPSSLPTAEASSQPASAAWIAGAVIGPIVGIAIIAGLILLRRKRRKQGPELDSKQVYEFGQSKTPVFEKYSQSDQPVGAGNVGARAELDAQGIPAELPASRK